MLEKLEPIIILAFLLENDFNKKRFAFSESSHISTPAGKCGEEDAAAVHRPLVMTERTGRESDGVPNVITRECVSTFPLHHPHRQKQHHKYLPSEQ